MLRRFLDAGLREIRILSRDEKKQDDMRKVRLVKLKFYIGDVRDPRAVMNAMRGVDYCFHAAALKQVPSCEFHPMERCAPMCSAPRTCWKPPSRPRAARGLSVHRQGRHPINAMGISKEP